MSKKKSDKREKDKQTDMDSSKDGSEHPETPKEQDNVQAGEPVTDNANPMAATQGDNMVKTSVGDSLEQPPIPMDLTPIVEALNNVILRLDKLESKPSPVLIPEEQRKGGEAFKDLIGKAVLKYVSGSGDSDTMGSVKDFFATVGMQQFKMFQRGYMRNMIKTMGLKTEDFEFDKEVAKGRARGRE